MPMEFLDRFRKWISSENNRNFLEALAAATIVISSAYAFIGWVSQHILFIALAGIVVACMFVGVLLYQRRARYKDRSASSPEFRAQKSGINFEPPLSQPDGSFSPLRRLGIVVLATAGVVIVGVLLIQRSEPLIVLRRPTTTLNVPAQVPWYDTGVTVSAGDHITFKASGKIYIGAVNAGQPSISDYQGPAGAVGTNTSDQGKRLAFIAPGLVPWSLVGKIGPSGAPFQVGEQTTVTAQVAGRVFLTVNDNNFGDNSGSWNVSVAIQDP